MVNYYHVLGLTPSATQQQIREAYQRISTQASNNGNAHIDRMLVNEAYVNLFTPENQRIYNEWLRDPRPLGNQSLAFLNVDTVTSAEAAGYRRVNGATSSAGRSPPAP